MSKLMRARSHAPVDAETSDAEMAEFERAAELRYRQMIGADESLNDASRRARRHRENTPLTPNKPW